jgi:hypothetical protein
MKRAIFAVLVVLLAMLAVTCDSAVLPAKLSAGPGTPPPEPGWTTISIAVKDSSSRARAMDQTLNKPSVNFFEVVFFYDGSPAITVRDTHTGSAGALSGEWKVTIPAVDYTSGTNTAVLFAGVSGTPNVLVAIGSITSGGDISGTDTSVTFTLEAIESGVNTTYANSSFKITGDALNPATIPTMTADTVNLVPVFKIATGVGTVAATYTFTIPKVGAVVNGAGTVTGAVLTTTTPTHAVTTSAISGPVSGDLSAADVAFNFTITRSNTAGYSKISIAVPVIALNNFAHATHGKPSAETWSLRGGLDNNLLDTGANGGGAVLLEIVEHSLSVSGPSNAKGWDGTATPNNTWTISLTEPLSENIVLTATPTGITGTVTISWRTTINSSTTTPATDTTTDPDATTAINGAAATTVGVGAPTNNTLTINSGSTNLTGGSPRQIYVYGVANEGTDKVVSNVIKIDITNSPVFTSVTIEEPVWTP